MRNVKVFLSIAALANLAVTLRHLCRTVEMHPGLLGTTPVRIAIQTGTLTIVGLVLLGRAIQRSKDRVSCPHRRFSPRVRHGLPRTLFRRRSLQCVRRR